MMLGNVLQKNHKHILQGNEATHSCFMSACIISSYLNEDLDMEQRIRFQTLGIFL